MAEEIIFKARVDSGNSVGELGKIEKATKSAGAAVQGDLSAKLVELKAKVDSGSLSMRQLSKVVAEYQSVAIAAGRTSPIGQQALSEAAELYDTLGDLRNEVARLGDDQKALQGTMQIGQGVIAGYGAVQSVMALTGGTSEALEKSLQKLMAVQTLLNSVTQIRVALEKESAAMLLLNQVRTKAMAVAQAAYTIAVGTTTGAMKALRIAMLAIPFVAVAAGVMALVSAMDWFFSSTEKAEAAVQSFNRTMAETTRNIEARNKALIRSQQHRIDMMTAEGATEQELHQERLKMLALEEKARKDTVRVEEFEIQSRQIKYKLALNQGNRDLAKEIKAELEQHREKYRELRSLDGNYANAVALEKAQTEAKISAEEEKARADRNAKWKAAQDKRKQEEEKAAQLKIERERLMEEYLLSFVEDENIQRLDKMRMQHQREREELVKKFGEDKQLLSALTVQQESELNKLKEDIRKEEDAKATEAAKTAFAESMKNRRAELEGRLIQMRDDFDASQELKKELAELEMQEAISQEGITQEQIFLIKQQYAQKEADIDEETKKRKQEINDEIRDGMINANERAVEAVSALSDAFFSMQLSNAQKGSQAELAIKKKQFELNKKMQIAESIMSGAKGIINIWSAQSTIPQPFDSIFKAIQTAGLVATTVSNIVKIKNTQFEGGGSASGTSSGVAAPNVSVPDNGNSTLTAGLAGGGSGGGQPTPPEAKVKLVDSDVKIALDNSAKVSMISTIG